MSKDLVKWEAPPPWTVPPTVKPTLHAVVQTLDAGPMGRYMKIVGWLEVER